MSVSSDWELPLSAQPKPQDYRYDLDLALSAVVSVRSQVPENAFTVETLGAQRAGHGVLIRPDGLVLTIGYLITEAEDHLARFRRRAHPTRPRARLRPAEWVRPRSGARSW